MKKLFFLVISLVAMLTAKAQWVDDPATNTFLANCGNDDGELYMATNPNTGDTYIQWEGFGTNGWSPTIQRINFEGVPQWGDDGIHIGGLEFSSYSEGVSMITTADGGVVSCFADYEGYTYAVKINADGTFAWGEQGLQLFDGQGFSRTEMVASTDGGFWALGADYNNSYMQYVQADGTLNPTITISADGYKCMFGQPTLGINNYVFLTYERLGSGFYTNKDICLVGYDTMGNQITPNVLLMSEQTFQSTYIHYVVPDGFGGGYVYIWHPAFNQAFNVYVFHFDESGTPTITDTNGVPVHSPDPSNFYGGANGTVDPVSHDLIIAYEQTDASTQSQSRIYMNRITASGEKVWGDGILVADYVGDTYSEIKVDAFEDGSGFSLIYTKTSPSNPYFTTIEAMGFDMDGNPLWTKTLCSNVYRRTVCDNTPGFVFGQNIIVWVNCIDGGIYGQNIGTDGTMGPIEPVIPVPDCPAPENLEGEYVFDMEAQLFGVQVSWTAPETQPLHYNLYRHNDINKDDLIFEVPGDLTSYFDESGLGSYKYQLTAVYEDCESDYALTPAGEDYVYVEVTGIEENTEGEIFTIIRIFNANGQVVRGMSLEELPTGLYILQGVTKDGNLVSKKVIVNK